MAKVKIILDANEKIQDVESDLLKAINFQNSGDIHSEDLFDDPAMTDLSYRLQQNHKTIYANMLTEIFETLENDYIK